MARRCGWTAKLVRGEHLRLRKILAPSIPSAEAQKSDIFFNLLLQ
jgi:hypothetical protein